MIPLTQGAAGCGRAAVAPVAPLGKNADFESAIDTQQHAKTTVLDLEKPLPPATVRGWFLRSVGRDLLRGAGYGFRVRFCGAKISRRERGVSVFRRPDRAYGRVAGVCICGQSLVCPVCAPRIAAFRSAEVALAYTRARDAGFEATLDTYTMPHWSGSSLGEEIDTFGKAWRQFTTARMGALHRNGYLGNHTAREITFSDRNGWHYHHHQLRYHKPGTHDPAQLQGSWLACLGKVDRLSDGALEHAFHSDVVADEDGAKYTAKIASSVDASARAVGLEVSASSLKGRNIVRLLGDFAAGDRDAGATWLHAAKEVCSRKVSSVRWSPDLRNKLGLVAAEKSDEQIAQEERLSTDEFLGELTAMQWRCVLLKRGEFGLVAAAQRGRDAVNDYLAALSCGEIHTDGLPEPTRLTTGLLRKC